MTSFEHEQLVDFFSNNRSQPADLYPSERRFLPWLAANTQTVLDVGSAAGGFQAIWHAFNPSIRYTGVDVSQTLVAAARRLHPETTFLVGDAAEGLPLPDRTADVVQALGWLHWEPRYEQALPELWRLAARRLFFDVRLVAGGEDIMGVQQIAPQQTTPYVVVSWPRLAGALLALNPARILAYGYEGPPAPTTSAVPDTVVFAAFVLERGDATRPQVCLDLPLPWPAGLEASVERYSGDRLRVLVPESSASGGAG